MTAITGAKAVSASVVDSAAVASPSSSEANVHTRKEHHVTDNLDDARTIPLLSSEDEAKKRFSSALKNGVEALMRQHGYGRERASEELLRELVKADELPPVDDEVFRAMESLGVSLDDATKAVTVSRAFQRARSENGSAVAAIDDLTSRLGVAKLLQSAEPVTSSVEESHATNIILSEVALMENIPPDESLQSSDNCHFALDALPSKKNTESEAKMCQRTAKAGGKTKYHKSGRKRALAVSVADSREANEDRSKKTSDDVQEASSDAVEEIVNAKMSMDENKPAAESSVRAKSPIPAGARTKRGACHRNEESQDIQQAVAKRARVTEDI